MKTSLNTQTQNEVKELLNEYIVSPLNEHIKKNSSGTEEKIENVNTTIKNIDKKSKILKGQITVLEDILKQFIHFDNLNEINAIDSYFEDVVKKLDTLTKSKSELEAILKKFINFDNPDEIKAIDSYFQEINNDFANVDTKISDVINKTENIPKELSEKINTVTAKTIKDISGTFDNSLKNIKSEITEIHKTTCQELNTAKKNIVSTINNDIKSIESSVKKISKNEACEIKKQFTSLEQLLKENHSLTMSSILNTNNQIESKNTSSSMQLEKLEQKITADNNTISSEFQNLKSEIQKYYEKQYHTLFKMTLSVGIANLLCIIVMIVVYLLK